MTPLYNTTTIHQATLHCNKIHYNTIREDRISEDKLCRRKLSTVKLVLEGSKYHEMLQKTVGDERERMEKRRNEKYNRNM